MATSPWDAAAVSARVSHHLEEMCTPENAPGGDTNLSIETELVAGLIIAFSNNAPLWADFQECVWADQQTNPPHLRRKWGESLRAVAAAIGRNKEVADKLKRNAMRQHLTPREKSEFAGEADILYRGLAETMARVDVYGHASQINTTLAEPLVDGLQIEGVRFAFSVDDDLWQGFCEMVKSAGNVG